MKVIYLAFLGVNFALELPSYFPKCCLNDPNINNCILEAAMKVKPYIQNGVEELGINPLYPVVFPYFPMDHSAEHGEFLSSNKDFTIYGMNNYNVESIQFYAKEMILKGKMNFNELFVHCLYETVKGHLVNIPIEGKGIYGGLLGPINITFEINVDLIERNGTKYARLEDVQIRTEIKQFACQLQGLIHENGPWGNSNEILRQNSQLVGKGTAGAYVKMFTIFLSSYLKWFFGEIPFSKIFPC